MTQTGTSGREWAASWSRRIGEALAHHRRTAGLTAADLAERCVDLGYPISRSQIAGIESGRKEAVTVAEVQVFARAIGVSPVLLLFPLGREQTTEALPGVTLPTWVEVQWWMGEGVPVPIRNNDGRPTGEWESDVRYGPETAVELFSDHERDIRALYQTRAILRHPAQRAQLLELVPDVEESAVRKLLLVRELMRAQGLVPPPLPDGFLPGEPVDESAAPATAGTVPTAGAQTGAPKGTTRKAHHAYATAPGWDVGEDCAP